MTTKTIALLIAFNLLSLLDVLSTRIALSMPGMREANPLVNAIGMDTASIIRILVPLSITVGYVYLVNHPINGLDRIRQSWGKRVIQFGVVIYLIVFSCNTLQIAWQ